MPLDLESSLSSGESLFAHKNRLVVGEILHEVRIEAARNGEAKLLGFLLRVVR